MAFITTYNVSKFNKKNDLSENTWFKYPYIYNIVGGTDVIYIYRRDIVNNTSELYKTIDTSSAFPKYSYYSVYLMYKVRSDGNYPYVILYRRTGEREHSYALFKVDIENSSIEKIRNLYIANGETIYRYASIYVKNIDSQNILVYHYYWYRQSASGSVDRYVSYQIYKVNIIDKTTETLHSSTSPYTPWDGAMSYIPANVFPTIIDNSYKFLKYGAKTQAGSYITKAGFTDYENPSTYDTYNSQQYYGNLILEFNEKYYVIGGNIGTNVNTTLLELNKNNLEANLVYETNATSSTYMAYTYQNNMYIVYTDGTDDYLLTVSLKEYNLNYGIKSNDGSKTYFESTNNSPIKAITFNNVAGTNTVGYVIETLSDTLQGSFEIDEIQNKQLSGFSTIINATTIQIPLNQRVEVDISTDTNFYTVYTTYRPLANTFKLELYNNTSEDNRVDKTNYLTKVGELAGVLREESSLVEMSLTLELEELPLFNYVYIEQLNRYYYVTDIVSVKYKLWEISLSVDVLMSYKNALLSCSAFVDRNENSYDNTIIDKKRVIQQGYDIEVSTVTNELLDNTSTNNIVLTGFYVKSV